ncbi:recombinase family protein [Blastococcus sp. SYSU DS0973]
MPDSKRVLIYTRISKDDTGEGKSNARQEDACRQLAAIRGWTVVDVVEDISYSAYSGKKRPGWDRVLEVMRSGTVDVVMAWAIDRITRSTSEFLQIAKVCSETGVAITTASGDVDLSTEMGKALGTIQSVFGELEVERKAARQRLANQQRAAQGKPWSSGWRPFGYELDGTVIPREADLIRKAADDVLTGASLRSVVGEWKALGVSTPRSSKGVDGWTHNGLRKILLNPRNAGLATYKGEVIGQGGWEPIIAPETHALLVAKLTDPSRLTRRESRGRKASNLLTGIAHCAVCDEPVAAGSGYQGRLIYQCASYHISTPRDDADAVIREAIVRTMLTTRPGLLMPLPERGMPSKLWEELQAMQSRMNTVAASFAEGVLNQEQMTTASRSLQEQKTRIEQEIADAEVQANVPTRMDQVREFEKLTLDEQRGLLARVARIKLYPRGRGKKNVPITHQVTLDLRVIYEARERPLLPFLYKDGDTSYATEREHWFTALDERPRRPQPAKEGFAVPVPPLDEDDAPGDADDSEHHPLALDNQPAHS